jgi:hypothetical protein
MSLPSSGSKIQQIISMKQVAGSSKTSVDIETDHITLYPTRQNSSLTTTVGTSYHTNQKQLVRL